MKYPVLVSGLIAATMGLSGCVGGTTYGTGVSHEKQTLDGVLNMFSLGQKKQKKIDYSARADLVIPSDKQRLREPVSVESSTSNPEWPESPEQKIARIRGDVVEADERSGQLPVEELRRKKEGIKIERRKTVDVDRENDYLEYYRKSKDRRKKVLAKRKQLAYSNGPKRKFLTEPPTDYRKPAATAVAGDQGLDPEVLEKRRLEEEKRMTDAAR